MIDKIKLKDILDTDFIGLRIHNIKFKIIENKVNGGFSLVNPKLLTDEEHYWSKNSKIQVIKEVKKYNVIDEAKCFIYEEDLLNWLNE